MISSKYTIHGRNLEEKISGFVRNFYASAYESSYKGGFVRIFEDNNFFNKINYIVIIRVDTTEVENGIIKIEVISGGAEDRVLIPSIFGGEKRRVKGFAKELQEFCNEHFINYTAD
jgi:hypothetical protein